MGVYAASKAAVRSLVRPWPRSEPPRRARSIVITLRTRSPPNPGDRTVWPTGSLATEDFSRSLLATTSR